MSISQHFLVHIISMCLHLSYYWQNSTCVSGQPSSYSWYFLRYSAPSALQFSLSSTAALSSDQQVCCSPCTCSVLLPSLTATLFLTSILPFWANLVCREIYSQEWKDVFVMHRWDCEGIEPLACSTQKLIILWLNPHRQNAESLEGPWWRMCVIMNVIWYQ